MLNNSSHESGSRDAASRQESSRARPSRRVRLQRGEPVSSVCFGRASAAGEAVLRGLAASLASSERLTARS